MIEQIRIFNLGVIEEAELNLTSGLTVLTGETGAGKTMAVTSLQLLLGAKPDPKKVRRGAQAASVEGIFTVPLGSGVLDQISQAGGMWEEDGEVAEVVISRHVPVAGRSRSFVGGRSVPTAMLREIAGSLVSVHGQSDQIRLATPSQQCRALDEFGGEPIKHALGKWQTALSAQIDAETELETFEAQAKNAARERLALEALLLKVDAVAPESGEDEQLKAQALQLENSEGIFLALSEAAAQISGSDAGDFSAILAVETAQRSLGEFPDPELEQLRNRLSGVVVELTDIAATVSDRAAHTEADPEELARIYARRQKLAGLRKDLAMDIDQLLKEAAHARIQLAELSDPEGRMGELTAKRDAAVKEARARAKALHKARCLAAKDLSAAVTSELPSLALPDATCAIDVEESGTVSMNGTDSVRFLLSSAKGAPALPLNEGASGGELSRIMLAVEVSLAHRNNETGHTFLFDEVDAGVGGRAALSVGKRLAELAHTSQVLVVTHLAQVAAYASTQTVVRKETSGPQATTTVGEVVGEARLSELARMLSGTDSPTARAHAAELLSGIDMAR